MIVVIRRCTLCASARHEAKRKELNMCEKQRQAVKPMTPQEFADLSGLGICTVYRMLKSGELKAVYLRRHWLINRAAAYELLGITN